jgi:putative YhdH/YhfP family quinone oxidoreductase
MTSFQALVVSEQEGEFLRSVGERQVDDLPQGEVLIRVRYSSLNYKDALSATGNRGVTRVFPHTPGIDAAGEVVESSVSEFAVGDEVVVTGYDLGMNTAGGFGQYIRVPAHWVVQLPEGLTLKESMGYGTAGFTAALSVYEMMEAGVVPDQGEVVVTGATGGVGSLAVAMLAKEGFSVVAATGKASEADFLKGIGASEVMGRGEVDDDSGRPILSGRWAGGVDTVGGNMLATLLKTTNYGGAVTCCGLVASPELDTTVFPFILRGIKLIGIDSVLCPMDLRLNIWEKIATDWKVDVLDDVVQDCGLADLDAQIDRILAGQMRGRVVVDLG